MSTTALRRWTTSKQLNSVLSSFKFFLAAVPLKEGEQGDLHVLILSTKESRESKRPAIVFLHSTNKCKEWVLLLLVAYASHGYIAVAVDSRHHVNGNVEEMDDVEAAELRSQSIHVLPSRRNFEMELGNVNVEISQTTN
ncbi:hypothetical protein L1987_85830 [Smallanthus sonchifolius]|uniref:Uncharacterized protein n=1 Tax=Smallanthus sonchifolius TaxID=185202 RepID=A0ACB8XY35_9ASTR|nr:hypothetical protein L1987_85830 [Smallanthus sonchifolius]